MHRKKSWAGRYRSRTIGLEDRSVVLSRAMVTMPLRAGDGTPLRPAWVEIDLDALTANLRALRGRLGDTGVLAVVKADAYGHGAVPVARALEAQGVEWLGVAIAEEGVELRRAGVRAPILVLGVPDVAQLDVFAEFHLVPIVSSLDQLDGWLNWDAGVEGFPVHLKVDSGMRRLGIIPREMPRALERLRGQTRLRLTGVLSHLACSEDPEPSRTEEQRKYFESVLSLLTSEEASGLVVHLANSAAALHVPACHFSLARIGLGLYGIDPSARDDSLRPVMSVRAKLVHTQRVAAGQPVGYGGRWRPDRSGRYGIVPLGYADGLQWRRQGSVALLRDQAVPIVGSISMDMAHVDLTGVEAQLGDIVTILGTAGAASISARNLADQAGTIPYVVLTSFGLRLPRAYLSGSTVGQVVVKQIPAGSPDEHCRRR